MTNQLVTIQNFCWRCLGIWVQLTMWWMMIAGLALNKHSSSSKVKQTLQRKLQNLLFVKATQRSKSTWQIFKTLNPVSGLDLLSQQHWLAAKPSLTLRGQCASLFCPPGKLQNILSRTGIRKIYCVYSADSLQSTSKQVEVVVNVVFEWVNLNVSVKLHHLCLKV